MIVDDSAMARMFVRRCIEITKFFDSPVFLEAENGKDAYGKLKEQPVSVVFTDLTMPEMDGEALLKRIKASPLLCDISVIVVSSACNPARMERLMEMGALGVLDKPLSPPKVLTLFRELPS
jgi:two-component system chemotaxis response regulator CheY